MISDDNDFSEELSAFIVNISRFDIKKCIDSGGYADVWTALDRSTGDIVVLKRLTSKVNKKVTALFLREVATMAKAEHPFFLKLIGFSLKNPLTIISEYMPNGSLFNFRQTSRGRSKLTNTRRTLISMGIAHAMTFLHSLNIIHRDLKSLNILLDENYLPILCDFGIARFVDSSHPMTHAIGTPHWMAPEILSNEEYGPEVDVYSYSMILYELLTDDVPWSDVKPESMLKQVLVDKKRPQLPRETPPALKDLIKMCWSQNPKSRPSFYDIYIMFEKEEVLFDDTDLKAVRSLAKQLRKIKLVPNGNKKIKVKSETNKEFCSDDQIMNIKNKEKKRNDNYNNNSNKMNHKNMFSSDDNNERKAFRKNRTENNERSSDGIRVRKLNKYNKESPFIDIDAVSDSRSFTFRSELKKAATSLQKVQSRQFMNAISEHFKGKTRPAELTAVLTALQQIVQKRCHRDMFIELDLHHQLPLQNEETMGACLDVLLVLFEKTPQAFESGYTEIMTTIISKQPQKAIMLLSLFAKSFDSLTDGWNMIDLLIQKASTFLNSLVGPELVSILFFLCHNFADFKKARNSYVISVLMKALQSKDKNTVKLTYNALTHFYKKNMDFDFGIITDHLCSETLAPSALQLLVRINDVPCLPELINALLELATKHIEATLVLLKLSALEEGAILIVRKPKWITQELPTIINTLRIFLAVMTHIELRAVISRLRQTLEFFIRLCEENDSRVLTHLSMIIRRFNIDKELVTKFSESGVFRAIFTAALDFADDIALHAAMLILLKVGKVGFAPEYLMMAESFKEVVVSNRKIAGTAVSTITLLSQYPLCAKKFKDLKFDKLFKQLLKDPYYKEYAETFLENLSVVNFY